MSNSYSWSITSVEIFPFHQDKKNVVSAVEWVFNATDNQGNYAGCHGKQKFEYFVGQNFISLDQLEETNLIEWVKSSLEEETIQNFKTTLDEHLIFHSSLDVDNPRRIVLIPKWNTNSLIN